MKKKYTERFLRTEVRNLGYDHLGRIVSPDLMKEFRDACLIDNQNPSDLTALKKFLMRFGEYGITSYGSINDIFGVRFKTEAISGTRCSGFQLRLTMHGSDDKWKNVPYNEESLRYVGDVIIALQQEYDYNLFCLSEEENK